MDTDPQPLPAEQKRIAVVILNWNGAEMLRRFLPIVLRTSADEAEVIVADNGSTDHSLELLEREFPEVRLIRLPRNYGFAEGYDRALEMVDAEFFLLLNSDVEPADGWLRPLISYMDEHPEAAAAQPKLLSYADRTAFEYAGAAGGYIDRLGYPFCRGRVFATVERDNGQYDTPVSVHWATGAALLIRRTDWETSGGLDPRFFAHQEEIDLCWRLRLRGRSIVCVPQSVAWHVGGATLPQGNPRKTYLNFRNNLTMLFKCLPEGELRRVLFLRRPLDYLAALQLLLKGDIEGARAIRRARRDFRALRPQLEADRLAIQKTAVCADIPERKPFSLLVQYYLRGRHTFSALP